MVVVLIVIDKKGREALGMMMMSYLIFICYFVVFVVGSLVTTT